MIKSDLPKSLMKLLVFLESKSVEYCLEGDVPPQVEIIQIATLIDANKNQIAFFSDPKRKQELRNSLAGIIILRKEDSSLTTSAKIIVKDPYYTYALVTQFLNPLASFDLISESATIDPTASLSAGVFVADGVIIGENVQIGKGVQISAGCVVERNVVIGNFTRLLPNVTIMNGCQIGQNCIIQAGTVIGGEGFGFAPHLGRWERIPQLGRVLIRNYVSIGNNTTIDRGSIGDTIIEDYCIIDNLVHIAHNVKIGKGTAIAAQVGFAGSVTVGGNCVFAGQVGVAGHVSLVSGVSLMAKAGVTNSIKDSGSYSGFPAVPTVDWQRNTIRKKNLQKMAQQVKCLEKELLELKSHLKYL